MAKRQTKSAAEPKIAEASMSAGVGGRMGPGISGKQIEDAMSKATLDALAKGITDPDEILALKMKARERVKADAANAARAAAKRR